MRDKGYLMAERMGFEPMKELLLYTLSKRAPSTARPPLHKFINIKMNIKTNFIRKIDIRVNYIVENTYYL